MQQLACPFAQISAGDRPLVGGKAATLAELAAAGISVPPGFAVTARAFECALASLAPLPAAIRQAERLPAGDTAAIAALTGRIRAMIAAVPLPAPVRDAITGCYRDLAPAPRPVAVRSSATDEDGAAASFAGLADTYLWVQGEAEVAGHVRQCWASLYSAEAVSYRRHQGLPEEGIAMAVVVQAMVEPRTAGVMFTRSPLTGDPSVVVIEASWGLGSALVSGDVTPDSYVVSKVTGQIVKRTIVPKLRCHARGPAGRGVGVQEVPAGQRELPCLADAEIQALAALGLRISEHYGCPQDIEWAVTDAGPDGIVVLQSRPETVWSRRQAAPVAAPAARPFDHVLARLSTGPGAA